MEPVLNIKRASTSLILSFVVYSFNLSYLIAKVLSQVNILYIPYSYWSIGFLGSTSSGVSVFWNYFYSYSTFSIFNLEFGFSGTTFGVWVFWNQFWSWSFLETLLNTGGQTSIGIPSCWQFDFVSFPVYSFST